MSEPKLTAEPITSPCPRCGRQPRLVDAFEYRWGYGEQSLIGYRYECRRWFGLRVCFSVENFAWNEKGWGDLAARRAVKAWNDAAHVPSGGGGR